MFHYFGKFRDIAGTLFQVDIYPLEVEGNGDVELHLGETPVTIQYESSGLFTPIKSQTCTINIRTDGGLFDLYTLDPRGVLVCVWNCTNGKILFRGYATPCQYGQDWTTIDTLSLECVEMISALKEVKYEPLWSSQEYLPVDQLIAHVFANLENPKLDQLYHSLFFYWPKWNFQRANNFNFQATCDFLHAIKLNEANFFDDDDEHTPWSYYEVLEEICKFFNVTCVPYDGAYWFIDYQSVAATTGMNAVANFWQYSLDLDIYGVSKGKSVLLNAKEYSAGTSEIGVDDVYNKISVDANRYDLPDLTDSVYDDKKLVSINKEQNMGSANSIFTHTVDYFWWWQEDEQTNIDVFKKYYRLAGEPLSFGTNKKTNWYQYWWMPDDSYYMPLAWPYYYSTSINAQSQWNNTVENKYLNMLGAYILFYAAIDKSEAKPASLDWKSCIMFNAMTPFIQRDFNAPRGWFKPSDIDDGKFELPAMKWTTDYEMNYSPREGTSYILLNGKLWYQSNWKTRDDPHWNGNKTLTVTDTTNKIHTMYPLDECTTYPAHTFYYFIPSTQEGIEGYEMSPYRKKANQYWGQGWKCQKAKLKIGDNYWNGSGWTTTESTFYLKYLAIIDEDENDSYGKSKDSFAQLTWMNMISNTTYQDKISKEGYAIPITTGDDIKGKLEFTLYIPRIYPADQNACPNTTYGNPYIEWWAWCPTVYMKDFSVEYVYVDAEEWYLSNPSNDNKDIKYSNDVSKDAYVYEKSIECKINTWQSGNPIAKSYPIINMDVNGSEALEYLQTIADQSWYNYDQSQEDNIINRQLRHYKAPMKKFTCHRRYLFDPWSRITMNDGLEIDGTFVVDSQEYDVRLRNATATLVEYGDNTIYTD